MSPGAGVHQFDRDQVIFCIFAVSVLDVPATELDFALRRSAETGVPLGEILIQLEILDESEVRALERMVNSVPSSVAPKELHQGTRQAPRTDPAKRYLEQYTLGAGGMGKVLIVEDSELGRQVALKEAFSATRGSKHQMSGNDPSEFRFRQEVLLTAHLEHPSIVPVYDSGFRDGIPYYTMRFIRGRSFLEAVQQTNTLDERLVLFKHLVDVTQAIAFAHSRGIVHRDISPTNIMLGEFGETVVLDWGLAKAKDAPAVPIVSSREGSSPWTTQQGTAIGTPFCMAPEQAEGKLDSIDERTDIFAIGALLYLILTGQPPYPAATSEESVLLALIGKHRSIHRLEPSAPNELVSIASKAMELDPADRYRTMTELRDELLRFQNGAFLRSHQYSLRDIFHHYSRRHRYALLFSFLCLLAVAGVATFSYLNVLRARNNEAQQREIAERLSEKRAEESKKAMEEAHAARMQLAQTHLSDGNFTMAEQTLDAIGRNQRDQDWDLLRTLATPERLRLSGGGATILSARFSMAGDLVAAVTANHSLRIFDAHAGQCINEIPLDDAQVTSFSFDPGGKFIVVTTEKGGVSLYRQTDRAPVFTSTSPFPALCACFSEDGNHVLAGFEDGSIRQWSALDGRLVRDQNFNDGAITTLHFLANDRLAITRPGGPLRVISYPDFATQYVKPVGEPVVVLSNGRAGASRGANLTLFDVGSGENEVELQGESGRSLFLHTDTEKRFVVSTVVNGPCMLWDTKLNRTVRALSTNDVCVDAWVTNNPLRIVTCGARGSISVWQGERPTPVYTRTARMSTIALSDFRRSDNTLMIIGGNEECDLWSIDQPGGATPCFYADTKNSYFISGYSISPDESSIAARLNADFPHIGLVGGLGSESERMQQLAFGLESAGGNPVLLSDGEVALPISPREVAVWSTDSDEVHISELSSGQIAAMCTIPRGAEHRLLAALDDGEFVLLDKSCNVISRFKSSASTEISALTCTKDGENILSGTQDGRVMLFRTDPLTEQGSQKLANTAIRSIACLDTEKACMILFADGEISKWNWQKNTLEPSGIRGNCRSESLTFEPEKMRLSINSIYDSLQCYDANSSEQELVLPRARCMVSIESNLVAFLDHSGVIWKQDLHWLRGEKATNRKDTNLTAPNEILCLLTPSDFSLLRSAIQQQDPAQNNLPGEISSCVRWVLDGFRNGEYDGQGTLEVGDAEHFSLKTRERTIHFRSDSRLSKLRRD